MIVPGVFRSSTEPSVKVKVHAPLRSARLLVPDVLMVSPVNRALGEIVLLAQA